ncbi:MAG: hypothetical protein ACTSXY_12380 [Promethearchaeota archaeon]
MELRKINKKASIEDIFFLIVTLLGLALFLIIVAYTIPKVIDGLKETDINNSEATRTMFNEGENIINRLDPVYLIIFAGLIISIFITSFMIQSHPIFIPIYILLLGFAIIIGVIANHVYDEFAAHSDLATIAANQTFMVTIMNNFIAILVGVGILSMIIIFAKPFQGGRV